MPQPRRRREPTPKTPKAKARRPRASSPRSGSPLTFTDLLRIGRIAEPAVAPNGRQVAYVLRRFVEGEDRFHATIHLRDLVTDEDHELTPGPGEHTQPVFSPDSQTLAFVSKRDDEGPQLWLLPLTGGEAHRLTEGIGGVASPTWSPDGKHLAFARDVIVSEDYAPKRGAKTPLKEAPPTSQIYGLINEKSSAKIADALLFRHWDTWRDRRRKHVFLVDVRTGRTQDITPGDWDAPPLSLGSSRDFDFSPDGKELAFVANPDEVVARSTNNCIFLQPLAGLRPKGPPRCISVTEASDTRPRYSADGRFIFYLAMEEPGYEADRNRIKAYDRKSGETTVFLESFDRSPATYELVPGPTDGNPTIVFSADDLGYHSLYRLDLDSDRVLQLTRGTTNGQLRVLPDGRLLVTRESTTEPPDLFVLDPSDGIPPLLAPAEAPPDSPADAGCAALALTHERDVLAGVDMRSAEAFWYPGAGNHPIHGFLIKPPGFSRRRRYPLILLIHGGPQGAFGDAFHYRWNAQLFASQGACVAMINPRGSTGYGQRFKEQISKDWTGKVYVDLLKGVDALIARYPFIDPDRLGAAGASFGGFMINWLLGHSDRFRAFVSHDGVFNAETMAYGTEELWFDEHEHGALPHVDRRPYLKSSPHRHVANFKTPTLVVQGEQDFRCPVSEGIGLFTALQVMGVPSRYLHFPDEGHWVQRPANAEVWYHEVLTWLMRWLSA